MFDFDGAHATTVRPPHKDAATPGNWAKDPSGPGANDGTRITASLINAIVGNLRHLLDAYNIVLPGSSDDALKLAILAAIDEAIENHTHQISALTDGGGFVRMTDAERAKLAAIVTNYKGSFANLAAVAAAYPTAAVGDWAVLMLPGEPASIAVWDDDVAAWVDIDDSPPATAATTPFTPAGNIGATNVQAALEELEQEKVPTTRQITGGGLAQGGGTLADNLQIIVPKAEAADVRGGEDDSKALTTKAVYDAAAEVVIPYAANIQIDFAAGTNFAVTLQGNPDFGAPLNTDRVIGKMGRIRLIQDATGNRQPSWDAAFKWPGDVAQDLSSAPGKEDFLDYEIVANGRVRVALTQDIPT